MRKRGNGDVRLERETALPICCHYVKSEDMDRADRKSQKLGNVWVLVQLIFGPCWPMNLLNKNPNIA